MAPPAPAVSSAFQRPVAAAPFKPSDSAEGESSNQNNSSSVSAEVAKLLAAALRHNEPISARPSAEKRPWSRRKALVCTNESNCEAIANGLVAQDYDVFVAQSTEEALGRMREDRIDVLILESNFDPSEQGFAFVTREVKLMRPSERRRLFLIFVTPSARTMDLHAAFLHNANLVVNPADVERLPEALEVSIRHYNELYRDFNHALEMPAI
jgi:response regulator RpfG family c-di-GMP phosphodiesterase